MNEKRYCYEYPRPSVTVDAVVFGINSDNIRASSHAELEILLIERKDPPHKGKNALPGGFVQMNESLDRAVKRELHEETGLKDIWFEQLGTFGEPKRDPRGRVISVAYYALVDSTKYKAKAGSDAALAFWSRVHQFEHTERDNYFDTGLAFDHNLILKGALERLRSKIRYAPIGFHLLPRTFTLSQLKAVYEAVLGQTLNGPNFRRKILGYSLLKPEGIESNVAHRPAKIYSFDFDVYSNFQRAGFNFEI